MKKNLAKWGGLLTAVIFAISCFSSFAYSAGDRDAEIEKFLGMLNSKSQTQRVRAAKLITRSGISSPELFDPLNQYLLDHYKPNMQNPEDIDEFAWLCKALASSGRSEYLPTLRKIEETSTSKLKRYAEQSIILINEYAARNAIMSDDKYANKGYSPEVVRLINMLKSDNDFLNKNAAKKIYRAGPFDDVLYEILKEEILAGVSSGKKDDDTLAWMCKALGSSGDKQYIETLKKVIKGTSSAKLKQYARQSLNSLQ
jgi:hypothetical protein